MKYEAKEADYKLLQISSAAFGNNELIPAKYTCDGANISPPLMIEGITEETKSLALIVDDPDAPGKIWVHWVMWNLPVTHQIKEGEAHGIQGMNDFRKRQYGGPCPPSGTHRYFFKVYALDTILELPPETDKEHLEKVMAAHIISFGELVGLYKKR